MSLIIKSDQTVWAVLAAIAGLFIIFVTLASSENVDSHNRVDLICYITKFILLRFVTSVFWFIDLLSVKILGTFVQSIFSVAISTVFLFLDNLTKP